MATPPRRKCEAVVKTGQRAGEPCRNYAVLESDPPRCGSHADDVPRTAPLIAKRQEQAKTRFLEVLRETGDPLTAATAVSYALSTIRDWRFDDVAFAEEWEGVRYENVVDLEQSFYARGKGLKYTETTRERRVTGKDDDGNPITEMVVVKEVDKILFDTAAGKAWLAGNEPTRYRDARYVQPPEPRRQAEEDLFKKMMADPDLAAAMDAVYDADLTD